MEITPKKKGLLLSGLTALLMLLCLTPFVHAETDVTAKVQLVNSRLMYDLSTSTSYINVSLKNGSPDVVLSPVKVVIDSVTPADVTVVNADGVTENGKPYVEYTTPTGQFLAGETIAAKRISFKNPKRLRFTYTTKVFATIPEAAGVIGPEGGEVAVTNPSSPINGVKVTVPENALEENNTISISYNKTPPGGLPADATLISSVLRVDISSDKEFKEPVKITLPFTVPLSPNVDVPAVFYWDAEKMEYDTLQINDVDYINNSVTFSTIHFTDFLTIVLKELATEILDPLFTVDTGFAPEKDGFFHKNVVGYCLGMSVYSKWYFENKKNEHGEGLYSRYKEGVSEKYEDDLTARQIMAQTHYQCHSEINNLKWLVDCLVDDYINGLELIAQMKFTKKPQLLVFKGLRSSKDTVFEAWGHAVVVYKYENGKFYIYDNNAPARAVTLDWSPSLGFHNYSKEADYGFVYNEFSTVSLSSILNTKYLEAIDYHAETKWTSSIFAPLSITSQELELEYYMPVNQEGGITVGGMVSANEGDDVLLVSVKVKTSAF